MASVAGSSAFALAGCLLVSSLAGCGGGDAKGDDGDDGGDSGDSVVIDGAPSDTFDRQGMVAHLAGQVIFPTYEAFATRAAELADAVATYRDAVGDAGESDAKESAQAAWRTAMAAWQRAEMMLVGPAAMNERTLRDRVYSWPLTSSCAVDQDVKIRLDDPLAYDISSRTVNRRGLAALEYILFTTSLEHTCPSQIAPAGWDVLSDGDKVAARAAYAADAAADVQVVADEIVLGWSSGGGDYLAELSAGTGSSLSPQVSANLISDAMFYLDTETKDMKLGEPAGIVINSCGAIEEACAAELESPWAAHSAANIGHNLVAFEQLFSGDITGGGDVPATSGLGFDEFLRGLGSSDLADDMAAHLVDAKAAIEAISPDLEGAITADRDSVVAAHAAVKQVTDDLKSQFLTVLGLDAPDAAAGDND